MKKFINDAWSFGKCCSREVGSLLAVAAFALVFYHSFLVRIMLVKLKMNEMNGDSVVLTTAL